MQANQPPIVITGGSVTVLLDEGPDENQLKPEGNGKFYNANRRIDRVVITGEFTYSEGVVTPKNGNVTVNVYLK
jgi:hypothetical protein